ncbi:hypothetical protein [Armatimonas sp.]|uniref:TolB family protein n=1 Tax=Armatimonas sp. TaxID=1872638 RepID=UPI00286B9878|nr:hypothetical protein [Armatimonas sp.]
MDSPYLPGDGAKALTRRRFLMLSGGGALAAPMLLTGCGGGNNAASAVPAGRGGVLQFTIVWPESSRLIPSRTASVKLLFYVYGDNGPIYDRLYKEQVVERFTGPGSTNTVMVTLSALPFGPARFVVSAHPSAGGLGIAQARGTADLVLRQDAVNNVSVTLASTISRVRFNRNNPLPGRATSRAEDETISLRLNEVLDLAASAEDADGNLVLTDPTKWVWESANGAVVSVTANGDTAQLRAVSNGSTTLKATESESGKAYQVPVTVLSAGKICFQGFTQGALDRIYMMNADGTGLTQVTPDAPWFDQMPDLSPDGRRITFSSSKSGGNDLYVMNTDGSGVVNLPLPFLGEPRNPIWSPDGQKIAFHSSGGTYDLLYFNVSRLYVINADGTGLTRVTDPATVFAEYPTWSPDGSKLAYLDSGDRQGQPARPEMAGINVINADGSGSPQKLAASQAYDYGPNWSPDGAKIAFTRGGNIGVYDTCVMNADGSGTVTNLTKSTPESMQLSFSPVWSPDGRQIAFGNYSAGVDGYFIDIFNADGTGRTRVLSSLTSGVDINGWLSWA